MKTQQSWYNIGRGNKPMAHLENEINVIAAIVMIVLCGCKIYVFVFGYTFPNFVLYCGLKTS